MSRKTPFLNNPVESRNTEQNRKIRQEQERLERLSNRELRRHIHVNPAYDIPVSPIRDSSPLLLTNIPHLQFEHNQEIPFREEPEGPSNSPISFAPTDSSEAITPPTFHSSTSRLENLSSLNQFVSPYLNKQRNKLRLHDSSSSGSDQEQIPINEGLPLRNLEEEDFLRKEGIRSLFQESTSNPLDNLFSTPPENDLNSNEISNEYWEQEHEQLNERLLKISEERNQELPEIPPNQIENLEITTFNPELEISAGQISLHNPTEYINSLYTIPSLIDTIIEFGRGRDGPDGTLGSGTQIEEIEGDNENPLNPEYTLAIDSNPNRRPVPPPPPPPPLPHINTHFSRMENPRLLNIAPFPYFYGKPGDDPDAYLDRFTIVAVANDLPQRKYITSFPGNLVGIAGEWYANLDPRPLTWEALRTAFLTRFRPQAFQNSLMDQLGNFRMGPYENVDSYYTKLKSLLHKWHNHQMPDSFILNSFIRGLVHPECIYHIKIANPATLEEAYLLAKRWEEARFITNTEQSYLEQDANFYPIGYNPNSVYNQPGMDSYGRDYYPKRIINPTPLAIKPPQDVRMQPLALMPAKDDA
jgi:hypothetical protein